MAGLSVSDLVRVTVSLTPSGAQPLSFGILMVAGDSSVINGTQRVRSYPDYPSVVADFGTSAPESKAAQLYFGQSPQPAVINIGRWLRVATAGENDGGILTTAQQAINLWQSITSGGFHVTINGVAYSITGLDFSAQTNLNGVATVIAAALVSAGATGATCVWNGSYFVIGSGTAGAGVAASGTLTFTGTGTVNDTIDINGKTITLVTGTPAADEVLIGGSATATASNLMAYLLASTDALLTPFTYSRTTTVVTVTEKTVGTAGNSIVFSKSCSAITISGSGTLTGGLAPSTVGYLTAPASGNTDISLVLLMTSALSQALIPGFDAETPAACAAALCAISPLWYGLMFQASTQPTDDQSIAVSDVIEAQTIKRVYGVTITNTNVLSSLVSTDLASRMQANGYNRSCCQYSQNAYAIASFFGRNFSVNYAGSNTAITVMYKQEPSVAAETITEAQAATLKAKNCNVFVNYVNDTSIVQFGVMASGTFFDVIHDTDWLQNAVQTGVYNVLFTTPTKIPQTDSGMNQILTAIAAVAQQGVDNGVIAPGTWNGPSFGSLASGQYLKTGYYIYASPIALQSQADRAARKAPPIQMAVKLAGAIQTVDILIDVNQ